MVGGIGRTFKLTVFAIGMMTCSFINNSEARLPREVAFAVVPDLLKMSGVDPAHFGFSPADLAIAVIRLIYTEVGNQEIVDWAKGQYPTGTIQKLATNVAADP
jgi:hypothetical protein